jgi:SOS regulatory protein LexA
MQIMGITKKQKEVYDYIVNYNQTNGYAPTQKELKEHFNLKSYGSVQRYIKYLADAGYIEKDWNARRGLTPLYPEVPAAPSAAQLNTSEIPLLGNVAAGIPIEAIENSSEHISVPAHMVGTSHKYFALNVQGESMIEDGILDGDVIVCRYQQTAENGQTIVAVIDGEATVKNLKKAGNNIELLPANSTMSPIVVSHDVESFQIVGKVVGLVRTYE